MKYIYGKYDTDQHMHTLVNGLYMLFVSIGRYVQYCHTPEEDSFLQFCDNQNRQSGDSHVWKAFRSGYQYIRDTIFSGEDRSCFASGRMLRKMACKYPLSRCALPQNAPDIIQAILEYLENAGMSDKIIRQFYLDFVGNCCRCISTNDTDKYSSCAWSTLGFQMDMLADRGKHKLMSQICKTYEVKEFPKKCYDCHKSVA